MRLRRRPAYVVPPEIDDMKRRVLAGMWERGSHPLQRPRIYVSAGQGLYLTTPIDQGGRTMSDTTPDPTTTDKGEGRGRGKWTAKGVQAAQSNDIEALKSLVEELASRLDALEAGETEPTA